MNNFSFLPSNDTDDGIVERGLDIEDSTVSQFDESPIEKSLESLFEQVLAPTKTGHQSEIARFNDNTLSYLSPQTKKLHSDILKNRPANLFHHNNDSIRASRKNMLTIIDYMIDYGELLNNPKAAKIFDDMEKCVQDLKMKIQQLIMSDQLTQPKKGLIEFAAFTGRKRNLSQDSRDMWDSTLKNIIFLIIENLLPMDVIIYPLIIN